MKLAWITDTHFDFLSDNAVRVFLRGFRTWNPDVLLLGGDTSISQKLDHHLRIVAEEYEGPIYYVLGNHDYYGGSIERVREACIRRYKHDSRVQWLPKAGVVELTPTRCLIGNGGWGDGGCGDFMRSPVVLNDYRRIKELTGKSKHALLKKLQSLGEASSRKTELLLKKALVRYKHVFLLTHVPPFLESAWHENNFSDVDWAPHFTCEAMGDMLRRVMRDKTGHMLTVLCGHTHSPGEMWIKNNIQIKTGGPIVYGQPSVQAPIYLT